MSLMLCCRVKKVSREEDSIGFLVVDISVVAMRNVFNQSDTRLIASQSVPVSKQFDRSEPPAVVISDAIYALTASLKSSARPRIILSKEQHRSKETHEAFDVWTTNAS